MQQLFHYKSLSLILRKKDAEPYDFFFQRGSLLVKTAFYKKSVPLDTLIDYVEMYLLIRHYGYSYEPALQNKVIGFFKH